MVIFRGNKKGTRRSLEKHKSVNESHQVLHLYSSVVTVGVDTESSQSLGCTLGEWVGNQTITGLEANLGLEGVLTDGTNHLQGNIRTIEQTSVIR